MYHVACDDKTEEHLSHHEIHLHFNKRGDANKVKPGQPKPYPSPAEKAEQPPLIVPAVASPTIANGRSGVAVAKDFGAKHGGIFYGRVAETHQEKGRILHHVVWEDQDEEDMDDDVECDEAETSTWNGTPE